MSSQARKLFAILAAVLAVYLVILRVAAGPGRGLPAEKEMPGMRPAAEASKAGADAEKTSEPDASGEEETADVAAGQTSGAEVVPDDKGQKDTETDPATKAEDAGGSDGSGTPTPTPEPHTLTISAAGDCTLGTDAFFNPATSFVATYNVVGDPGYFLANVRDIFAADDLTIVNLEGTFTESEARAEKQFAFKGDASYAKILTEGSVEAANLANNHSKDYGEQSYQDTIDACEAVGVRTFGYDRTVVMDVNGVKVGLTGTYELAKGADAKDDLLAAIEDVKAQGAELIICSFHWGTERENYPDAIQQELAHAAIDAGAHLVLGHHPHVLQGIETYKGRKIVYSLGNFCFGGNSNPSDKDTMIFQQTFTVTDGAVAEDDKTQITPCRISSRADVNNYQPTPFEGEEAERVLARIEEYSAGIAG